MDKKRLIEHREALIRSRKSTQRNRQLIERREKKLGTLQPVTIEKRIKRAATEAAQLMKALIEAPASDSLGRVNNARAWNPGRTRTVNLDGLGTFFVDDDRKSSVYTLSLQDEDGETIERLAEVSGDVKAAGVFRDPRDAARLEEEAETIRVVCDAAGLDVEAIVAGQYESRPRTYGK